MLCRLVWPPSRVVWDRVGSPVWKIKLLFGVTGSWRPFPCIGRDWPHSVRWQGVEPCSPMATPAYAQRSPGSRVPGGYSFVRAAGAGHGRRLEPWGCSALLSAVLFVDKRSRDIADRLASYSSSILAPSLVTVHALCNFCLRLLRASVAPVCKTASTSAGVCPSWRVSTSHFGASLPRCTQSFAVPYFSV